MTGTYLDDPGNGTPGSWSGNRSSAFTLRDFLIAAAYHMRIIVLAALIPLMLGIGTAALMKTQYTANSLLMVIISREVSNAQNITDSGPSVLSIEGLKQIQSEVQIIESADVIRDTIEAIGRQRLYPSGPLSSLRDWLSSSGSVMDRTINAFRADLRVTVLDESNVIQVSFSNPNREVAIEVANKLVEIYFARRRAIMQNPASGILMAEVQRFSRDLKQTDEDIQSLKSEVGIVDFTQASLLAANQVDAVIQRRRTLAERRAAIAGQLTEAERQSKEIPATIFDFDERSDALENDEDHNTLSRLLVERDRISMQYAPHGSMMREINRKIETIRKQIATRKNRAYTTERNIRNPSLNNLSNLIINLRVEADAIEQQDRELAKQQADAEARLTTLRTAETKLSELNRRRDTLSDSYRDYLRRATAAQIEEAATAERQSNVRLVQTAGSDVTSRNLRMPLLAASIFGAVLFGLAAGAGASAFRSNFITPQEVERAVALPMLGEFDNQSQADASISRERELGNLAALLLDTEVDGAPMQVMQFIGSEPDEALDALSLGIASEFVSQRGMRTLVVNLAAPQSTTFPGDDSIRMKGGLSVAPTSTPLLWVLAEKSQSPLLNIRIPLTQAEQLMDELRTQFDAVIFCSTTRDAAEIGHRIEQLADGNVLVIRAEKTRRPVAVALKEDLDASGSVALGFVFVGRRYILPDWLYRLT